MDIRELKKLFDDYDEFNEDRQDGLIIHTDCLDDLLRWVKNNQIEETQEEKISRLSKDYYEKKELHELLGIRNLCMDDQEKAKNAFANYQLAEAEKLKAYYLLTKAKAEYSLMS